MTGEHKHERDMWACGGHPEACRLLRTRKSASGPDRFLYDGPKGRFWTTGPLEGHDRSPEGQAAQRLRQAAEARKTPPPAPPPRRKRDDRGDMAARIKAAGDYAAQHPRRT